MKKYRGSFRLTHTLLTEHDGEVICVDERSVGRRFRLYHERPDARLNEPLYSSTVVVDGEPVDVTEPEAPLVTRVDIRGPIEQRAEYHECGGYCDGHDAIADRFVAALETSDVLSVIDSPGGAHAGLQEAVNRVVAAKAKYGRRITVYADEMIGSAAYWWAAAIADTIWGPESMLVGSIGARSGHQSIAGAMKKAGVETVYFTYPGPGKVAFAPEFPLSETGLQRGNRDTAAAGEQFLKAVSAARGIPFEDLYALDADVLHGPLAVKAGLVDGIASYEDVMDYALALASNEEPNMAKMKSEKDPKSPDEARAEEEKPEKDAESETPDDTEDEADEDEDDEDAPSKSDEDDEDEDEDEEPPAKKEQKKARASAGSLQSILGLHANASQPAVRSSVMSFVSLGKKVMSATNTKSPSAALGALQGLIDDAAESVKLRADLKSLKAKSNQRERLDLLTKLAKADIAGYSRGELFVDKEVSGKLVSEPSPVYSEMKLSTLRGLVESKLASDTPRKDANPFQPDPKLATSNSAEARVELAKDSKVVKGASSFSNASQDDLARSASALKEAGII